jgi:hypothetical protein
MFVEDVGFEVLTTMIMMRSLFLNVKPCTPVEVSRSLGARYGLCLQCRGVSPTGNWNEAGSKQSVA